MGWAPVAAGWSCCARITLKPFRRRTNGRAARCCPSARVRTVRYGLGPRVRVCIGCKTTIGPISAPPREFAILTSGRWPKTPKAGCGRAPGAADLFVQNGDRFEFAPGMTNVTMPMPALLSARDGGLWIGTAVGLLRYQAGKTNWFTESNGQPLRDVRTVAEDNQGAVWFGMAGDGLACLKDHHIQRFRTTDGLSSDFIECLHFDKDGALWIGTFGGGLDRFKNGHFAVINRKQGLPNSVIGDIEEDDRGFFWMSSHDGIIRVSEAELNRCADGKTNEVHCQTYGINDGMPTIECSEGLQPAGCKTPDGRLWFPTSKGLVAVNPLDVETNPLPPPVQIEAVLVDDRPVDQGARRRADPDSARAAPV